MCWNGLQRCSFILKNKKTGTGSGIALLRDRIENTTTQKPEQGCQLSDVVSKPANCPEPLVSDFFWEDTGVDTNTRP